MANGRLLIQTREEAEKLMAAVALWQDERGEFGLYFISYPEAICDRIFRHSRPVAGMCLLTRSRLRYPFAVTEVMEACLEIRM